MGPLSPNKLGNTHKLKPKIAKSTYIMSLIMMMLSKNTKVLKDKSQAPYLSSQGQSGNKTAATIRITNPISNDFLDYVVSNLNAANLPLFPSFTCSKVWGYFLFS